MAIPGALRTDGFVDALIERHLPATMEKYLPLEVMEAVLLIWLAGAMVFAGWHFYCYRRLSKQLRENSIPVPEDTVAVLLSSCKAALGINEDVRLMLNHKITSPMLVGLRRPMILLPAFSISGMDLKLVLTHELMHLKRKDLWVKVFALIAGTLHWFNPFAHILCKDVSLWGELSCDEALAAEMSHEERRLYGEAILNTLDNHSGINTAFCSSLCESRKHIERRLTMLLNVKKMKKHIAVFAVVTILAIGSVGTAVAALATEYKPNPDPDSITNYNPDYLVTHEDGSWVYNENGPGEIIGIDEDEDKILGEVQLSRNNIFPANISDKSFETEEVFVIFRAGEEPVYKDYDLIANNQVVCFDTQAELDAHVKIIKERRANDLNPYEGFEELYAHIDFNHPFVYTVSK